jgi:hypothetical protein
MVCVLITGPDRAGDNCCLALQGFGHYINEARASGAFIISTDHPPMNELVPAKIGLLISPDRTTSYDDMALGR